MLIVPFFMVANVCGERLKRRSYLSTQFLKFQSTVSWFWTCNVSDLSAVFGGGAQLLTEFWTQSQEAVTHPI